MIWIMELHDEPIHVAPKLNYGAIDHGVLFYLALHTTKTNKNKTARHEFPPIAFVFNLYLYNYLYLYP